jgi:hypothetical protein
LAPNRCNMIAAAQPAIDPPTTTIFFPRIEITWDN